jgi:hypothetical protein
MKTLSGPETDGRGRPSLQFGHFGKQIRGNSKILAVQKFFAGLENPIGVMTAGNGVTIRPRP